MVGRDLNTWAVFQKNHLGCSEENQQEGPRVEVWWLVRGIVCLQLLRWILLLSLEGKSMAKVDFGCPSILGLDSDSFHATLPTISDIEIVISHDYGEN